MRQAAAHTAPYTPLYEEIDWDHPTAPKTATGLLSRIVTACASGRLPHQTITETERTTAAGILCIREFTEEELRQYFTNVFLWFEERRLPFTLEGVRAWREAHFETFPTPLGLGTLSTQQNDLLWQAHYRIAVRTQHGIGIGTFEGVLFNLNGLPLEEGCSVVLHDRVITEMVYLRSHSPE